MQKSFTRRNFFMYTNAEESDTSVSENGISIKFEKFSDVAEFFTNLGSTGQANDNSSSTTNREIYGDDARDLARDATLETAPGVYLVSFPGWNLT